MAIRHKGLVAVGASLGGIALVMVSLYWFALPAYVESSIRGALRERGLSDATFSLESVSLSRLKLRNLRLDGANTLTVGRIEVDYSLADIMAGRAREVRLSDARWRVGMSEDYQIDWGSMLELMRPEPAEAPTPRFAHLRWSESHLVVETPDRRIQIPLRGSAQMSGSEVEIDVRAEFFHEDLHVHANAQWSEEGGLLTAKLLATSGASHQQNWISATARLKSVEGKRAIALVVKGHRRSFGFRSGERDWALADVVGDLDVHIVEGEIQEASGQVSATSLVTDELRVEEPRLRLQRESGALALEISGRMERCSAILRHEFSPRPGMWLSSGPYRGTWELAGALPGAFGPWLADRGIVASELTVAAASGRSEISRTRAGWRARLSDSSAVVAARTVAIPSQRLSIIRPKASLGFAAWVDSEGGEIALSKASKFTARSLRWRALSLKPAGRSAPAFTVRVGDEAATLRWQQGAQSFRAPELTTNLRAGLSYASRAHIRNLRGTLTVSLQRASPLKTRILWSRLRADSLRIGELELPNISARIRGRPMYLRVDASSQVTKGAALSVSATLDRRTRQIHCPAQIELPQARVEAADRLSVLIQSVLPVSVKGRLALAGRLDLCAPTLVGEGELRMSDVTAKHKGAQAELVGISGTIAFSSLAPIRTKGWQELNWKKTQVGAQKFGRGSLVFRSQSPGAIEIQRARLDVGGGQVSTSSFAFHPQDPDIKTTLFASGISVKKWLPIVSRGRAGGSGRVSGKIGLHVQWKPQLELDILSGYLRSEGRGHFAMRDRSWLRSVLQRYSAGFSLQDDRTDLVKDRLVGALLDFGYSTIDVRVRRTGGDRVLRFKIKGKGRRIPQELDLTVNVGGFEELIKPGLRAWLAN